MPKTVVSTHSMKTLGGNELERRVGRGGMGEVWIGRDQKLHRQVAVKMMRQDLAKTEDSIARFYQEARAVAKLNHPNIIQIFQIGEENGLLFFTMEWVDGMSLSDQLKKHGPIAPRKSLELLLQVIEGLKLAVKNNVIHRDIKPANLMITSDGQVKIADFGLAKILDSDTSLTSSGVSMGSPNYMSPEMARGELVDHRADIYSLGITFFQMLTGTMPFTGASATAVILKQIQDELPITEEMYDNFGPRIIEILNRMTHKKVEFRYPDYDTLKQELQDALVNFSGERTVRKEEEPVSPEAFAPTTVRPSVDELSVRKTTSLGGEVGGGEIDVARPKVGLRPAVFAIPLFAIAILALAFVGYMVMSKTDGEPNTSLPVADGLAVIGGDVFLKMDRGTDAMAGQSIGLYNDMAAEDLRIIRSKMINYNEASKALSRELRDLLNQIRELNSQQANIGTIRGSLQAAKDNRDKLMQTGGVARSTFDRLDQGLKTLTEQFDDFDTTPYEKFPIINPITGQQIVLSSMPGKKDQWKQYFEGLLRDVERKRQDAQTQFESLQAEYNKEKSEIELLTNQISRIAEATSGGKLDEMRETLKLKFRDLVDVRRRQAEAVSQLAETAHEPVKEAILGREGEFEFPPIPVDNYIAKVFFDLSWKDTPGSYVAVWLHEIEAEDIEPNDVRLTQENMLFYVRQEVLEQYRREWSEDDLQKNMSFFLSGSTARELDPGFSTWVQTMLSE